MSVKRITALCLALVMMLSLAVGASAASNYSLKVQNKYVQFYRGGNLTGSYLSKDGAISLNSSKGDLLVCFIDSTGKSRRITLGSQSDLSVTGSLPSLSLPKTLDSDVQVTIGGTVNTLTVAGANKVTVSRGATVTTAKLTNSKAKLTAASGSSVKSVTAVTKSSVSGTVGSLKTGNSNDSDSTSGSSALKLSTQTIDADYGDKLSSLQDDLEDSVTASYNGRKVPGKVSWVSSGSTVLRRSGTVRFLFTPDSGSYKKTYGSVYIDVDGDGGNSSTSSTGVKLTTKTIRADSGDRLRDLEDDLEDNVKATYDGKTISGEVSWDSSRSTVVKKSGSYKFVFEPDSSRYKTTTGTIRITVDGDDDDDDDIELRIGTINVKNTTTRLRSLVSELEDEVRAYDDDGDRIDGEVKWVSDTTRVTKTGYYEFYFIPDSSRYDRVRDEIKITVNGSGSSSSSSKKLTLKVDGFKADRDARLYYYEDELEDNVTARNKDGDRVSGEVEWVDESARITKTGSYDFYFIPDSSKYEKTRGQIKITVSGSSSGSVHFSTSSFRADKNDRLYDYEDELEDNVHAYNSDNDRLDGEFEWVDEDTKITKSGYYSFYFYPDSSRYDRTKGQIKINLR
ncbi:hypothetical protein [uncultured Anaerotruncus sp.]|uniref:hypothetical protein n=1 Tax=uncultured Anaerotruncus sp. TaxID=905011 RepID=UPI00280AD9D0|nr:hypothetical protein [uncultured Anaerotruncus sp.]